MGAPARARQLLALEGCTPAQVARELGADTAAAAELRTAFADLFDFTALDFVPALRCGALIPPTPPSPSPRERSGD